jgi:hypothetical protein
MEVPFAGPFPMFYGQSIAYDVARARTVLVTGRMGDGEGTWEWDGASWTDATPTGTSPPPRYMYQGALAYDAARRRTVLCGGSAGTDTWEWNGSAWRNVTPPGASPPQWSSGLTYDSLRQRTMLVSSTQTWEWDGAAWTSITPATFQASGTLVYDGAGHRLVAADGPQAWAWNGVDWIPMAGPGIDGGAQWLAAFDSVRGRMLLYDPGAEAGQSTWEWTGAAWVDVTPAGTTPPPRRSAAMAFDSERGRSILFGGALSPSGGVLQDTWEWDGSAWRDATPPGTKPAARRFHALAYDSGRHRTVLFSGNDIGGDVYWNDTWELEARPAGRPAVQFDASMSRTGIAPEAVTQLVVRAWAGGAFALGDPSAIGATLRGWTTHSSVTGPGGWAELAANDAGAAASPPYLGPPGTTFLAWSVGAPVARRFVTERDGQLSFQVVPSGTMGADVGGARVALDYIEVRVRYKAQ